MDILKTAKNFFQKNSSQILTTVGIIGYGVSMYLSVKAYEECKKELFEKSEELKVEKLPAKEIAKTIWKPCLLPALTFASSTICVLGAQNILLKKNAALLTAYKTSETAFAEFQRQTKEKVGEETYKQIRQKTTENLAANPNPNPNEAHNERIIEKNRYYDEFRSMYFRSTDMDIKDIFTAANNRLIDKNSFEDFIPYQDIHVDLYGCGCGDGDDIGYYAKDYSASHPLTVTFGDYYVIAPDGGRAIPIFYDHPKPWIRNNEQ